MKSGIGGGQNQDQRWTRFGRQTASTLFGALALLPAMHAWAAECRATSGATTAALIELYTSEGCSSCPPADRWLSKIPLADGQTIPLAFHVDYWDYIGWPDRFAQAKFSLRQRDMVAQHAARFAYTPQVMLGGREYSDWAGRDFAGQLSAIHRTPARAKLSLELKTSRDALVVQTTASTGVKDAAYYLALVEDGLSSEVRAGENRGATLRHDHVVREWLGPFPATPEGAPELAMQTHRFALKPDWTAARMRVVAVVQQRHTGAVLQALSAKLCPA